MWIFVLLVTIETFFFHNHLSISVLESPHLNYFSFSFQLVFISIEKIPQCHFLSYFYPTIESSVLVALRLNITSYIQLLKLCVSFLLVHSLWVLKGLDSEVNPILTVDNGFQLKWSSFLSSVNNYPFLSGCTSIYLYSHTPSLEKSYEDIK